MLVALIGNTQVLYLKNKYLEIYKDDKSIISATAVVIKGPSEGEYNYKYTVNTSLGKTVYTGTKTKEKNTGYRENSEGLIKYEINNEGIFQINMDEKVPLENLYLGLNENYLDIQKIYDLASTLTENINEEENEIIYENDNIGIKFKIDEQNILSINIKDNNDDYLLEFDNIK